MKKIFMTLSASVTLASAIILGGCNNAAEVQKQTDEQNAKIQTMVDEKLNGLQEEANTACAATIDSLADVQYTAYLAETKKKPGSKPKAKPTAKKEEPKKTGIGDSKIGKESTPAKIGEGKVGTTQEPAKLGKGKVGVQDPPK